MAPAARVARAINGSRRVHRVSEIRATTTRAQPPNQKHARPPRRIPVTDSRPSVLITAPFDAHQLALLRTSFEVTSIAPSMDGTSLAQRGIDEQLAAAEVIVAELDLIDEATLALAPNLAAVVSCRAKPVNVDLDACSSRGIPVITTPGRNAEVTADLSFALLMATVRHVSASERWLRAKNWTESDVFEPYERFRSIGLGGRTLGILGGGAVGRRMLRRALGFGMKVKVYDPFLPADAFGSDAVVATLDEVMSTSDIVTVHVPLMAETEGLIGARELALMKSDAFLINAGRAAIIDEQALMAVLREHRIAGAGFDVFYQEPLPYDSELFALDNVTMTPHIAGASDDVIAEHSRIAAHALQLWLAGEPLPGVANAKALTTATAS
ncbi:hydroxyacid dehydrogenase [Pseudoclavibacter sp. RFBJ3]|nr:hydroxyacid dehydrogenase [Pseudoclavibacter sp. RFBJ5]PPF90812.1 hydroxyacid dehydrogenase [Pseudoclavibacter sp. RFBJ3]PPG00088.1 hydroxyacid dehydrogenase [Pseudoclavibacter sp. RFBH5]PPG19945.1 hydroxyacid dehydrogenase [Pseudoclavibacter sp. RFBI4]